MRHGAFLVMRYGPLIGRASHGRRRVSVVTRYSTASGALAFARGWMDVEQFHGGTSGLWIAKVGAPATRGPRR